MNNLSPTYSVFFFKLMIRVLITLLTSFIQRFTTFQGQKLKWTFETDGHFAYGIYFSKDPGEFDIDKMECVYPRFNVSHCQHETTVLKMINFVSRRSQAPLLFHSEMKWFSPKLGPTSFGFQMNTHIFTPLKFDISLPSNN